MSRTQAHISKNSNTQKKGETSMTGTKQLHSARKKVLTSYTFGEQPAIRKDSLQKVIILKVDQNLNEKVANQSISSKTIALRNMFAKSSNSD